VFVVDDEDKEKLVGLKFYYHYFNVNVGNSSHAADRSSMHYPNAQDLIDDLKENYYWLHIEDW